SEAFAEPRIDDELALHGLAVAADGRSEIVDDSLCAIGRERAAVAIAVGIRARERRERTSRSSGDDRREVEAPRQLHQAADDEAMTLIVRRRSPFGVRIESDRQSGEVVRVASAPVV